MTQKELNEKVKEIIKLIQDDNEFDDLILFDELASSLHGQKQYGEIINAFNKVSKIISDKTLLFTFELAYSYVELNDENSAEKVYEFILSNEPKNSAVLNNLSNIKKRKRKFKGGVLKLNTNFEIILAGVRFLRIVYIIDRECDYDFSRLMQFFIEGKHRIGSENSVPCVEAKNSPRVWRVFRCHPSL